MWQAIFFDAVGTLIYLPQSVGHHYAQVGKWVGLDMEARELDRAFARAFTRMPLRPAADKAREDDDKGWWRDLVDRVIDQVRPKTKELDRDAFFEAVYAHFAEPGVWELYPEVAEVLEELQCRFPLAIISNFDGRLRVILEHLGATKFFRHIFLSSELGADKPDPALYERALAASGFSPNESLYVGDDPVNDWQPAAGAGLQVFKLDRAANSLRDLVTLA
jgi:putative hydrolase of the HAD superfamily